ncbi:MAG TPA: hypothetical protein VGO61_13015 [Steroidobacteraceae bacterium]|nr:hypothetical protein [Steroidobacteraceae bacterium]
MKWIVILLVLIVAAAVGSFWYDGYSAESALLKQSVYRVLKKHEPELYEKLVTEYRVYARDETRRENFVNLANSEISLTATRNLAHASQDSVVALMKDMIATAKRLQKEPGDTCFRYWFPQVAGPPDIARYVDAASQAHTLDLMGEVIRTAAESPTPLPAAEAVKDNLANVINGTYEQYGADAQMLSHADDPRADRAKICTITISVYERIMALPPAESGALMRAMTQIR